MVSAAHQWQTAQRAHTEPAHPKKADFITHDQLPPAPQAPHSMGTTVLYYPPEQDGTIGAKGTATTEGRPFNMQPASVVTQAVQTAKKGSG